MISDTEMTGREAVVNNGIPSERDEELSRDIGVVVDNFEPSLNADTLFVTRFFEVKKPEAKIVETSLHNACVSKTPEQVFMLIKAGADPNAREKSSGNTPLHLACSTSGMSCASLLVSVPSPYEARRLAKILTVLVDFIVHEEKLPKDLAMVIFKCLNFPVADWTLENFAGKTPLDLLESDWDVSELEMDIEIAINRWNRGGKNELENFLPRRVKYLNSHDFHIEAKEQSG